jgi:hypothetical protein
MVTASKDISAKIPSAMLRLAMEIVKRVGSFRAAEKYRVIGKHLWKNTEVKLGIVIKYE